MKILIKALAIVALILLMQGCATYTSSSGRSVANYGLGFSYGYWPHNYFQPYRYRYPSYFYRPHRYYDHRLHGNFGWRSGRNWSGHPYHRGSRLYPGVRRGVGGFSRGARQGPRGSFRGGGGGQGRRK